MKKRMLSILLALAMALALLPGTALAFTQPPDTDFWVGLSREQVTDMISRISGQAETRDVVLLCYPSDGADPVPTAITMFAKYANDRQIKLYYYAFSGGAGDPSRIDGELEGLFEEVSDSWPDWPIAVTYNSSTKNALCREYVATLMGVPGVNGLLDLMRENGVSSGSAGEDPDPDPNPDPDPDPDPKPDIPTPPAPELPDGMDEMGWEVLRLANQHRMSVGREPLSVFDGLQDVAALRAEEIYADYRADHTRPDGRICWTAYQECGVLYHYSAENIASGQTTPASVMSSWLHSPGHRRNLESARSVHMGVGHYYGTHPSAGAHNWTQDFAAADNCRFTGMTLSAEAVYAQQGADLEALLADADLAVYVSCYRHGSCMLPVIAAMCTGYDAYAEDDQTVTIAYGGQTADLLIAVRHTWDGGEVTEAPTCTNPGVMTYTCTDPGCDVTTTASIPAAGHSFPTGSAICAECGTGIGDAVGDGLETNRAPAGLTEDEAAAYAEDLAQGRLDEMGLSGYIPSIEVNEYVPPVDETPDAPGAYGWLDYTINMAGAMSRSGGDTSPMLRLDIPPASETDDPSNVQEHTYIITFDANGGTVRPSTLNTNADGVLPELPVPSRTDYIFDGWYTSPTGGEKIGTDTVFSDDTTVYAHWGTETPDPDPKPDPIPNPNPGQQDGAKTYYTVAVPSVPGGKVAVNLAKAAEGNRVTITVVPNEGYELSSLSVTSQSGKTMELAGRDGGKYVFTMPGEGVTVEAVFQPLSPAETPAVGEAPWTNPFTDVSGSAWYYNAVKFVSMNGKMQGTGATQFGPNMPLSRAMLAQVLYNHAGRPAASANSGFTDVPSGSWYASAVNWAAAQGYVTGYEDNRFAPDAPVTREQVAAILWRFSGSPAASSAPLSFRDAQQISGYAQQAMAWAVAQGILQGSGDVLNPNGETTRAQAAQILMNYIHYSTAR